MILEESRSVQGLLEAGAEIRGWGRFDGGGGEWGGSVVVWGTDISFGDEVWSGNATAT